MNLLWMRVVGVAIGLMLLSGGSPVPARIDLATPPAVSKPVVKVARKVPKFAASAGRPLALKRRRQMRRERPRDIPKMAMRAYTRAARTIADADPACRLSWPVLAGIGRVESDHGKLRRGSFTVDGTLVPRLVGPPLNGYAKTKKIFDTDDGVLDGDVYWDRAVGPMQFIPSTWRMFGADGNRDDNRDVNNIFDSTLAAARYLCSGSRDLSSGYQLASALYSYNHSRNYVRIVLYVIAAYANMDAGSLIAAAGPLAIPELDEQQPRRHARSGGAGGSGSGSTGGGTGGGPGGGKKPAPKPSPTPDPRNKVIPIPTVTLPSGWDRDSD